MKFKCNSCEGEGTNCEECKGTGEVSPNCEECGEPLEQEEYDAEGGICLNCAMEGAGDE